MDKIRKKLLERPIEADTVILKQVFVDFEDFVGLFEKWRWDGITACSLILLAGVVDDEDNIIKGCFREMQLDPNQQMTTKFVGEYFFINFNFEVE